MRPCVHGNVCRRYYNEFGDILTGRCPHGCSMYEPKFESSYEKLYDADGRIVGKLYNNDRVEILGSNYYMN